MLKVSNAEVFGWEAAIRGMRNPKNSWDRSDTGWKDNDYSFDAKNWLDVDYDSNKIKVIGENDLNLMKILSKAGTDHSKYLRMIDVTLDIDAPLYWWKEFDTYKVGTVADSCSTMHKIHSKPIELSDFSIDDFYIDDIGLDLKDMFINVVADCEQLRQKYLETGDKKYWKGLIQLLPTGYNQKRTVQLNYAVLKNMYFARKSHKLDEWHTLCDWMLTLPYFKEICVDIYSEV